MRPPGLGRAGGAQLLFDARHCGAEVLGLACPARGIDAGKDIHFHLRTCSAVDRAGAQRPLRAVVGRGEVAVGHEDEQMAADLLDDFLKLAAGFAGLGSGSSGGRAGGSDRGRTPRRRRRSRASRRRPMAQARLSRPFIPRPFVFPLVSEPPRLAAYAAGDVCTRARDAGAVVEGNPGSDPGARFAPVGTVFEVDVLVLERAPQPLDENKPRPAELKDLRKRSNKSSRHIEMTMPRGPKGESVPPT